MVDSFACQQRLGAARLGSNFTLDQTSFVCAGGVEGNDACTVSPGDVGLRGGGGRMVSVFVCEGMEGEGGKQKKGK